MKLRSIVFSVSFLAGTVLSAQEVRIEVVELANGKPVVGANVSILDTAGLSLGGAFSDSSGHTVLRVPMRGAYRVRADKVGYDAWTSMILQIVEKPIHVRVGMSPSRGPLPVLARSETSCQQLTTAGSVAGDLWLEIKKALTASALTESEGLVPLDVDLYERVLDRNGNVISERTEQRLRIARRPSIGIAADQLDSTRRGEASSETVFRPPTASAFLSDQFVRTHCFAAIRGYGAEAGLAGLEFKPSRLGGGADLAGVLWLDPTHNALRSIVYDYVNLPIPLRVARTTGRVEFQQLPTGQWIVPRWYIRMPRVAAITSVNVSSPAVVRDSLLGYQEVGGTARLAGTPAPAAAPSAANVSDAETAPGGQTTLSGIVFDSTSGMPLKDVQVSIGGGRYKTVTSGGGRYELAIDGPVTDKVIFEHPRLRLLRVAERVQSVSLASGAHGQAFVIVPSFATLRRKLCGLNETGTDGQGMAVGYVRDGAGNPVFNAHVWATWQVLWTEQNGKLVSTNQQRSVETDTGPDGSYMLCGLTRGAQVTAKVSMAGKGVTQDKLTMPPSMVAEHNFVLGR